MELVNILNQCIFQWAVFNHDQAIVGKIQQAVDKLKNVKGFKWAEKFDFDTMSRGFEGPGGQLVRSERLIAGKDFSQSLDSVISAAKAKLAPRLETVIPLRQGKNTN